MVRGAVGDGALDREAPARGVQHQHHPHPACLRACFWVGPPGYEPSYQERSRERERENETDREPGRSEWGQGRTCGGEGVAVEVCGVPHL